MPWLDGQLSDGVVVFRINGDILECNVLALTNCDIVDEAGKDVTQGYLMLDEENLEVLGM